ncbi:MAG: hypothetical protein A2W25_00580 [candidate division Zixibacteria bacterium RBG_16_53_22]|nr:MAG: hypothetical protein A2W25_00580 [candidate division Zixibacteria bacterium RBG_16_53_22]
MRKTVVILILIFMAGNAQALTDLAFGVYGGLNAPIVQDDARAGTGFGFRVKFAPSPVLGAAAFFESRTYGDPEIVILQGTPNERTEKTDGGKVTVLGIEGLIGSTGGGIGPHFYWMVGLGNYKWTRDGEEDFSKVGYHLGPGLEIGFPSGLGIEAKAKFEVVPTDGGGSRKNLLIFVGANYHFGLM